MPVVRLRGEATPGMSGHALLRPRGRPQQRLWNSPYSMGEEPPRQHRPERRVRGFWSVSAGAVVLVTLSGVPGPPILARDVANRQVQPFGAKAFGQRERKDDRRVPLPTRACA